MIRLSRPWFIAGLRKNVELAAASRTLTAGDSGKRFVSVVDGLFQLPKSIPALKGVAFEFECGALSTGVGLSVSPHADDAIGGNGLAVVVDKDLINTAATDRLGDCVALYCTGATGATAWRITSVIGTWAKES